MFMLKTNFASSEMRLAKYSKRTLVNLQVNRYDKLSRASVPICYVKLYFYLDLSLVYLSKPCLSIYKLTPRTLYRIIKVGHVSTKTSFKAKCVRKR